MKVFCCFCHGPQFVQRGRKVHVQILHTVAIRLLAHVDSMLRISGPFSESAPGPTISASAIRVDVDLVFFDIGTKIKDGKSQKQSVNNRSVKPYASSYASSFPIFYLTAVPVCRRSHLLWCLTSMSHKVKVHPRRRKSCVPYLYHGVLSLHLCFS